MKENLDNAAMRKVKEEYCCKICTKEITKEESNLNDGMCIVCSLNKGLEDIKNRRITKNVNIEKQEDIYNEEEEYFCDVCFKKISEEDYELYDCMCEDCFINAKYDNDPIKPNIF